MARELASTMSPSRLTAEAVSDAFVDAVVPPGLGAADDARARSEAGAFLAMLLRHLDGDPEALPEIAAAIRAVASEVVRAGDDPGVLLDRFDGGRHVILRALIERGEATAAIVVDADDRLREIQQAARTAIHDAVADFDNEIDAAVAEVSRAIEGGAVPDEVLRVAAASLCRLVTADRARLWLETGGDRLELVASAGGTAPMGLFVSSEKGVLADILNAGVPVRQCPVDAGDWEAAVPNLPSPGSALFLPLAAAGRPFGMLYALRNDPVAFSSIAERTGARFVERVEPALAWAMQLRSLRRWADASQDFLRFVTHELRRPLTVLRGYLDMLDAVGPDEAAVLRERMGRAADQIADMLTGISDTVTMEDPVRPLDLSRISLGELVATAQRAARDEAEQQGVHLVVDVLDPDTMVQCDVDNVVHALANLLSNAFRHTAGQRRVWLSAAPEGTRFVRFTVRDEGSGISPGDLSRIFHKYYRSDATRRSGSAGSGLGLYFVRLVTERHGGRVSAENRPDGGASFTLELPLEPGLVAWSI
jgi:signal transduction histidine kinase